MKSCFICTKRIFFPVIWGQRDGHEKVWWHGRCFRRWLKENKKGLPW